ncbi:type I restriction-modification system subunit M [Bacillus xiapuensis]|uniref:type I restriction-modification system subunit M n=1 Tax=Bacillus xiapuensis TaxID=2014075 RepID=UPI000C23E8DF|nr:class I SAM-dependent DNA methyltransferase [Bacillus xiapuensis]
MDQQTYNSLKSFIWGIANDCLVDVYDVGDYRKIILPMLVIRRFDAVLEPKHDAVIAMKKKMESKGSIVDIDPVLCRVAGQAFCNKSEFTLKDLKSRTNQQQLKNDFINYLDGFSKNVQEIIDKFHFRNQINRLSEQDRLGLLIEKFVDPRINLSNQPVLNDDGSVRLPALDNHTMGTLFEEVIRMFNEETNITDAGRHFTPRDIVELMADIAFVPVQDQIQSTTYRIYDGACGTGGMLTVGEQRIHELAEEAGKKVSIKLFGQENADETYAIACADMLVKGEGTQADNIYFGSTISNDGFPREEFDFMLSNPPFGTSWKAELKAWGDIKKDDITDPRFIINYDGNSNYSLLPDIGDPQMLFLANNISKMKTTTEFGSRIVEVHNGSSLFTGKAGSGPSNLRRYIIENDMLEAIVALPENMFYNTGIGTFLWVVTNNKANERKGKVQLIDATSLKSPLRKSIGDKNSELTPEIRNQIISLYLAFTEADETYSKVFDNEEFAYYSVDILRPLRLRVEISEDSLELLKQEAKDEPLYCLMCKVKELVGTEPLLDYNTFIADVEDAAKGSKIKLTAKRIKTIRNYFTTVDEQAEPVKSNKGGYEPDKDLKDNEQIPYTYEGGIEAFFNNEILPYVPDAWIDENSITLGYELSFTKYFYKPIELREAADIITDIKKIEADTDGLLASIVQLTGGGDH